MSFRHLTWGQTPIQAATFHSLQWGSARSMIVDKSTANLEVASTYNTYNTTLTVRTDAPGASFGMTRVFVKVPLAALRAQLGHSPVLVKVNWSMWLSTFAGVTSPTVYPVPVGLYRVLQQPTWDATTATSRYYDGTHPWGGDAGLYAPYPGIDHLATPFSTYTIPLGTIAPTGGTPSTWQLMSWDITSEVRYCLQAGVDLIFMLTPSPIGTWSASPAAQRFDFNNNVSSYPGYLPYLEIWYTNPVEFFGANVDGTINLLDILNNQYDTSANVLDLGAVERGQIGTPVKAFLKNLGLRTLPHLEVWDNWPEWTVPVAGSGNAGSGALAYVTTPEFSVSQKYTIHFSSASAFYVVANAYADNAYDLQPLNSSQTGWNGTTGADLVLPGTTGSIIIPTAAWSGTPQAGDTIVFYVSGNSTPASWPYDSNQQVDMAYDSAGSPDATSWRNIKTSRTSVATGFTVNTTGTITVAVPHIDTTKFTPGLHIAVANLATIDYGVVQAGATATSIPIQFASNTGNAYAAGDKVTCCLCFRSLAPSLWAVSTGAAGADQTNPAIIPLTSAASLGFTGGQRIAIQDPTTATQEVATILSVSSSGITCTAYLTGTYAAGSMVTAAGSGEDPFWCRIDANASTVEELKRFRLNVRT